MQPNLSVLQVGFMQRIFDLKAKFDAIIEASFKGDKKFSRRLKEALEDFINRDVKCSSYLALYIDNVLKSGTKEDGDSIDAVVDKCLIIFRYLNDKDIFESFYRNHLGKRLLQGRSASEENEKLVVARLKAECGNQYTAKLEGMLTDVAISKTTLDEYRETPSFKSNEIELDVNLLTAGFWPSLSVPACLLPTSMQISQDSFVGFYSTHNSGRKLTWQTHIGTVDIRASFKGGKRDLTVSTYQACILALFNGVKTTLTLDEIREATQIVEHELRRHLLSLCTPKVRILNKSSKDKDILDTDSFSFNEEFTSKYRRLKVPLIVIKESAGEEENSVPSGVEENRRVLLEAAIVRIMKARKTLSHNHLLEEINKQVSHRFNPTSAAVKARIESLIEREFLKRDENDTRKYIYVA